MFSGKMVIIGLVGNIGCGKDYIAKNIIIPFLNKSNNFCIQMAFSDQLKVNVIQKYNVSFDEVFENKTEQSRKLLQHEGTEMGRNLHGKDYWINYFDTWYKLMRFKGINNIVVTDVRFKNELDYIHSISGIVIKIISPERTIEKMSLENSNSEVSNHVSEQELNKISNSAFDYIIYNDYMNEPSIKEDVEKILLNHVE